MIFFIIYLAVLAVMSLIACLFYFIDKRKAQKKQWRIRESVLFGLGFFGGAIGALIGMTLFRHKTKHWYFWVLNVIFLFIQVAAAIAIFIKFV